MFRNKIRSFMLLVLILIAQMSFGQSEGMIIYKSDGSEISVAISNIDSIKFNACVDIDGNFYKTVKIGDQWWMAENLKVTHYRGGTAIPKVTNASEWSELSTGAYCNYDNNDGNADTYGSLYNWYAVHDSRNIAPEGWHVPTDEEWKTLEMHLSMSQSEADDTSWRGTNEGSKLAGNAALWSDGDLENNAAFGESGFSALPSGYRFYNGAYYNIGNNAYFWSSTEYDNINAWYRTLNHTLSEVGRYDGGSKVCGFSVRCMRD